MTVLYASAAVLVLAAIGVAFAPRLKLAAKQAPAGVAEQPDKFDLFRRGCAAIDFCRDVGLVKTADEIAKEGLPKIVALKEVGRTAPQPPVGPPE